jgi:hypothetical protein
MTMRFKRGDPIERAISDLDQQIATVQRQMREATNGSDRANASAGSPARTVTKFVKEMLAPPRRSASSINQSRQDLFDVGAEPLKELEAEPIAFGQKHDPDLFTQAAVATGAIGGTAALEIAQVVPPQDKLAHYLGAGSIKSYKPLKRAQRQARNRFFVWVGLSCVALWIIWFVIR